MRCAAAGTLGIAFLLLPVNGSSARKPQLPARIVFVSVRAHDTYELFAMRPDGSGVRRLTSNPAGPSDPSWSPDGTRIAYEAEPDFGSAGIWIAGSNGLPARRLAAHGRDPAWAPDGRLIAFAVGHELVMIKPDGSGRRTLFRGRSRYATPSWSPDGSKLAFARPAPWRSPSSDQGDIYVVRANGAGAHRIAAGGEPAWSPGGGRIAFARRVEVAPGLRYYRSVWLMNVDGSGAHELPLTDRGEPLRAHQPAWSPDGGRLAIATGSGVDIVSADGSGSAQPLCGTAGGQKEPAWAPNGSRVAAAWYGTVVIGAPDGRPCRTFFAGRSDSYPAPSPDGRRLAFVRYGGVDSETFLANAAGKRPQRLTRFVNPAWSPSGSQLAVDDSNVFHIDVSPHPDVFVFDLATRKLRPIPGTEGGSDPKWSPNGRSIAFEGPHGLKVTTVQGAQRRVLTTPPLGYLDTDPSWSPDGHVVAFSRTLACRGLACPSAIYVVPAEGGSPRRLVPNAFSPAWSPSGGRIAFVRIAFGPGFPDQEIWVMNADGKHQRRLTRHRGVDAYPAWQPVPR